MPSRSITGGLAAGHPWRAALILGANAAALLVLLAVLRGRGDRSGGEVAAAAEPELVTAPAPPPPPSWLELEAGRALESDLGAIVSHWVERARVESKRTVQPEAVSVALHVRELGGGPRAQLGFEADRPLRPASNMKLVTTAAALVLLGPDWKFETPFESAAPIEDRTAEGGILAGDLVVRAGGDPLFEPGGDGEVRDLLAPVIAQLRAAGVRAVRGDLVLDEGSFPDPAPGPEWPDVGQHWTEYCALAGGFSANRGALDVEVVPGSAGKEARVRVRPAAHGLRETSGVRTTDGGRLTIAFHARSSGVLVRGTIPEGVRAWRDAMAHPDPVDLFGQVLAERLSAGGILLEGRVRRERGVDLGPDGVRLGALRSAWMPLLVPINTDSVNSLADQLFLATGLAVRGAGTRAAAAEATAEALHRLGVSAEGLVQVDGSGLSRANRVTAAQMTALLAAVLSGPADTAGAYVESLALAGETGTLDDRMRDGPARGRVRGKTGFIAGTSALSGVIETAGGRSLVFSILVNYPNYGGLNTRAFKPMQDALCERLVEAGP